MTPLAAVLVGASPVLRTFVAVFLGLGFGFAALAGMSVSSRGSGEGMR